MELLDTIFIVISIIAAIVYGKWLGYLIKNREKNLRRWVEFLLLFSGFLGMQYVFWFMLV